MQTLRYLLLAVAVLWLPNALASTRIYDVDPAYRQEVFDILSNMLGVGGPELMRLWGNVQLLPNGQLAVDTLTDERQDEVAAVLDAIASRQPGETPTVTLRYWLLSGTPGAADAANLPPVLDGVFDELEAANGELGFEVLDAASVTGRSGEEASLANQRWRISQTPTANAERLNAEIRIQHYQTQTDADAAAFSVELTLGRGEFVVLGASTTDQGGGAMQALVVNWP